MTQKGIECSTKTKYTFRKEHRWTDPEVLVHSSVLRLVKSSGLSPPTNSNTDLYKHILSSPSARYHKSIRAHTPTVAHNHKTVTDAEKQLDHLSTRAESITHNTEKKTVLWAALVTNNNVIVLRVPLFSEMHHGLDIKRSTVTAVLTQSANTQEIQLRVWITKAEACAN